MMATVTILPPAILQSFSPLLLMDFLESLERVYLPKILSLAAKKIRPQDVGKKRTFDRLVQRTRCVLECKKAEKAQYEAAIEEEEKKRSRVPNSRHTCVFRRPPPKESSDRHVNAQQVY